MSTINAMIEESCRKHANMTALQHKLGGVWCDLAYGSIWSGSDRIAAGLIREGFNPGDHAALLAPSSPRWVICYLGILKAGGVVVPIDKELKSAELRNILSDCDARILFTDNPCLDIIIEIISSLPLINKIVELHPTERESGSDPRSAQALELLLDEWRSLVASCNIQVERAARLEALASNVHRLLATPGSAKTDQANGINIFSQEQVRRKELVKQGRLISFESLEHEAPLPPLNLAGSDTAVILYTSGTTGRSKGAMLSHSNIVSNIQGATAHFNLDSTIHTLSFLPINHVFEQVCGVLLPLSLGGKVTFCESLKKIGDNLTEIRPTFLLGVPAVYRMLYDRIMKNIDSKTVSQLLFSFPLTRPLVTAKVKQAFGAGTIFISGGAALDPAVAQGITNLGMKIYQGYGITETSPIIAAESPVRRRSGTVGYTLAGVDVRILDPNEEQIGEIAVKGPNVMQGYYKNPQATAEVLNDGWYRTGDLGSLDKEGYLTICGRVKNLIVTPNGKNVYPEEVENEIVNSPYITEVMVYGHKVGATVEEVHAIVYPNQEAIDDYGKAKGLDPMTVADVESLIRQEIQKACAGLADYKRVRKFTLREDEFPKTTTRKIKRFEVEASIAMN